MPTTTLSRSQRDYFSYSDISRGESYFRDGHVSELSFDGDQILASVRGSRHRLYHVTIDLNGNSVESFECSCPQYDVAGSCKHAWAVLRKLDEVKLAITADPVNRIDSSVSVGGVQPSEEMPSWKKMLQLIREQLLGHSVSTKQSGSAHRLEPMYLLSLDQQDEECPLIHIELLKSSNDSGNGKLADYDPSHQRRETKRITYRQLQREYSSEKFSAQDQHIINELMESVTLDLDSFDDLGFAFGRSSRNHLSYFYDPDSFAISDDCSPFMLQEMVATGRFVWQLNSEAQPEPSVIERWISGRLMPRLVFEAVDAEEQQAQPQQYELKLELYSGQDRIPTSDVVWYWLSGHLLSQSGFGLIEESAIPWLAHFRHSGSQRVDSEQRDGIIEALLQLPQRPEIVWPQQWNLTEEVGVPQCALKVSWPENLQGSDRMLLKVTPVARYGESVYTIGRGGIEISFDSAQSRLVQRDPVAEQRRIEELKAIPEIDQQVYPWRVHWTAMASLEERLRSADWALEVEGRPLIAPGSFSFDVTSGVDWFDLSGGVAYADQIVPIPALLQAAKRREQFITLEDGSRGVLPSEWIEKFGKFLELAEAQGEHIRFQRPQAMLLDSLLKQQDEVRSIRVDAGFRTLRKKLDKFNGVKPAQPPKTFRGELREYQQVGLGWFNFLREFGFGGCLADDMGLGKTIQVLALLEQRRRRRLKPDEVKKPSLIAVPKSLIFNWLDEAQRFAPKLNIINYTGTGRRSLLPQVPQTDVLLTTYGTLRKDIEPLSEIEFDYAILDEAHAIKNAQTDTAKACYVIQAEHRLTMTGTPVENHLGDLWSQFRFLNPGLLGHSSAFSAFTRGQNDEQALEQLSTSVRPFILRRTKGEVLKELPDKTEQTLYCEMSDRQARQYKELRDHYRMKLTETVERLGLKRSKIQVLEALLRLRQTACDGRLVNARKGAPGAKLDMLVEQLQEVMSEGHKVLVFSQFTSLLDLLKKDLKKRKIGFEYLDGKTRDRRTPVDRFQNDEKLQLFLISLKAGGHGLNLTAADYVYILDPWWNPAVEAQAIDRAHRIGQTKRVFAYRMITRGTVEEKIVELQQSKRELADAIISGNNSLIRSLTADDLKILFD